MNQETKGIIKMGVRRLLEQQLMALIVVFLIMMKLRINEIFENNNKNYYYL